MNVFHEAAKNLRGHWTKGQMYDWQGSACAVGHLTAAMDYNEYISRAGEYLGFLNFVVNEHYPQFRSMADFNDSVDTTESMVIEMLEKAAAKWDERV